MYIWLCEGFVWSFVSPQCISKRPTGYCSYKKINDFRRRMTHLNNREKLAWFRVERVLPEHPHENKATKMLLLNNNGTRCHSLFKTDTAVRKHFDHKNFWKAQQMSFSAFIYKDKFEDYRMGNTAPSAHRVSPISLLSGDKIGSIGLSIYISVNARKTRAHDMDFSRGVDRAIYLFVCFFHAGLKTFHFYIKRRRAALWWEQTGHSSEETFYHPHIAGNPPMCELGEIQLELDLISRQPDPWETHWSISRFTETIRQGEAFSPSQ